ncbi:MAG: histidinol dehydrogenase, partial [Patulibacter sp.]
MTAITDLPFVRFGAEQPPAEIARTLRNAGRTPPTVQSAVAELIAQVEDGGDAALLELVGRHDLGGKTVGAVRVPADRLDPTLLDADVRAGLETAIMNVAIVADAGVGDDHLAQLPQGHTVKLREVPVGSAAIYAPGGQAAYPSTIVMGVVTARAAGVERICV